MGLSDMFKKPHTEHTAPGPSPSPLDRQPSPGNKLSQMTSNGSVDDDAEYDMEAKNADYYVEGDTSNQDDEAAERELDKDLEWTKRDTKGSRWPHLQVSTWTTFCMSD